MSDDEQFPEPVRRSTWSPPPRRPSEEASMAGDAATAAATADNDGGDSDSGGETGSPARSPGSYSGLNLALSPKVTGAVGSGGGGGGGDGGGGAGKGLSDSSDEESDLDPEDEAADHVAQSPSADLARSPAKSSSAASGAGDGGSGSGGGGGGGGAGKGASPRKQNKRMLDLSKQAQVLVQQKMRTENVLTLEEASKILSVLPAAALGALTAPRYIGEDWFEVMGPDRRTSYFYNTETGLLEAQRPDDVVIDKTNMFITELNRRRREDFYVKLKMAAAEGLLQSQLQKKYGKQILRDEKEKVKTRRASEATNRRGFHNHAENELKKERDAMQHLVHEFDPRSQKLISYDMFKAGIKKISQSKLYKTSAGRLAAADDEEMKAVFFGIAGEDMVLTTTEFEEFTRGPKPQPEDPPMTDLLWHFLNRVKSEMKDEGEDEEVGGGMETSIIRQLTFEVRAQARNTIVKSFRELEPVRYWGFIDLDLIANISQEDLTINAADEAERASRLKKLREQKNRILGKVQAQTYVSTTIRDIFFVGNLYKRAQSGAWILRQFVLTGEGVLQSQKVERKGAQGGAPLTTEELIAQANADFQAGKRESLNAKTPRRVRSGSNKGALIKDKFRLDPGNEFEAQIAQTSEVDFTLVEDGTRLRAKDEPGMNEWMTNLRNLYALLRQVHVEDYLKAVLTDAKARIAKGEVVRSSFFDDALAVAQQAELSSRNRTVKEIQDLAKYWSQIEALQAVIDNVKISRSIDDLLEGIYNARGIAQDSDIMFEAQDLMEQLTLEKNAEIALKLQELENEKKRLHARRQLLNALLDVFLNDRFSHVRRVEEAYTAFCHDKGIALEEDMVLFAQEVHIALERHVEQSIDRMVDGVAAIDNLASSIAASTDDDGVDEDIREQAEHAIKRTINTICANLATPDKSHRSIVIEKVVGSRNEYHVQQEDGAVVQNVHHNNLSDAEGTSPVSPALQERDLLHRHRVGQAVNVWHGINDYLHVQEQIQDAEVLGIGADSKIVMALEMLGRCLTYLRQARRLGIPCDEAFEVLRTDRMVEEEDYYLFDDTPFSHALNHMTLPEALPTSDFDGYKDALALLDDLVHYLDSCRDAALHCGLDEDANPLRRLEQLRGNLLSQVDAIKGQQSLYASLDDAVAVMTQATDERRWIPAKVVKNDLRSGGGVGGEYDGQDGGGGAGDGANGGGLIVDIQDTLLDGMAHVVTVPQTYLRTAPMVSICAKGYFEVDSAVVLRKDKDAWSDGFREGITISSVDVPQAWHEVDTEENPALRHELAQNVKYGANTGHSTTLSNIRAEQLEIPPSARVEHARPGDTVYVAHTFLHLPVLRARISEAVASGLDEGMEAFEVANALRERMEYDHALLGTALELAVARFPFDADPAAALERATDSVRRLEQAGEVELRDEDADLLALADRYMSIMQARAELQAAMLDASKLRNGLELKRALELAVSYGVNPTSALCKSAKQLMATFVGENSRLKAEQQLQKVCETSYPILPDICPKLQTALFVGVQPVNPALISRATDLLMGGLTRRTVQLADVFKVVPHPSILAFLDERDLHALLVNRQFYEYVMRYSYFAALQQHAEKVEEARPKRKKPQPPKEAASPLTNVDLDAPIPEVVTPFGFGSAAPRFEGQLDISPKQLRKIELEKIRRAREKLLRKMYF